MRSRLSRKIQQQNQKALIGSIIGIIIVLFLLLKYGLPFLVNVSYLVAGSKNQETTTKEEKGFIASPILHALPTATNSATFTISGTSVTKGTVSLYINDDLVDKKTVEDDGAFSFDDVKLTKGENKIKTKITEGKKESDFSREVILIYKDSSPTLTIDSPTDGKTFSKNDDRTLSVTGKTDPGVKVTINDFWAIVDEEGSFSYSFPLQNGENKITFTATDEAGNKTEAQRKVTYNP